MPLTEERRSYLESIYGKDTIDKMLGDIEANGKTLASMGVEYKEVLPENELVVEVDQEEVVEKAVKAIVENESFKEMVASIGTMAEQLKGIVETTIPEMQKQIIDAQGTAVKAEEKAQKKVDDIVADAFNPRAKGFRPSVEGEGLSEEDKLKEQTTEPSSPIDPRFRNGFLGQYADVS